jgi:hypothetical protein
MLHNVMPVQVTDRSLSELSERKLERHASNASRTSCQYGRYSAIKATRSCLIAQDASEGSSSFVYICCPFISAPLPSPPFHQHLTLISAAS